MELVARPSPYTGKAGKPWFDVKRFGAKGNGTTNDYAAIAAAIAAAALAGGGIIFFPAGIYICASSIVLPLGIPLVFKGVGISDQVTNTLAKSGTELRSTLRDGTSPAINGVMASFDYSLFSMEDMLLSGGTNAECLANGTQGTGSALGNFVGLSLKNRLAWQLRNVRIQGFDTDALRLDSGCYYGAAYNSRFMFSGCGVNSIDSGNVEGFYNCHFQYNIYGSKNLRFTMDCAWEGQYKSGAVTNILGIRAAFYRPYFEANNGSITAGEADIYADVTNYAGSIGIYDAYWASPSSYSARGSATYGFTGKCSELHVYGSSQAIVASPQNYAVFNLVGASAMYWHGGNSISYANFVVLAAGAQFYNLGYKYLDVNLTGGTTLTRYGNSVIRLTATGAQNLDNIDAGYYGQIITILFADTNVTVRHVGGGTGNIRLRTGTYLALNNTAVMQLICDPNGNLWKEVSRSG